MNSTYEDLLSMLMEVAVTIRRCRGTALIRTGISGIPAGHSEDNMYLPLNVNARLTANEEGTESLVILEPAAE